MSSGFANVRAGLAISAGTGLVLSEAVTLSNSNGVTFGASNSASSMVVTASFSTGTSLTAAIQSVSAGTTRITTGRVVLSNSNGIQFGDTGQTLTAQLVPVRYWQNGAGVATYISLATASTTINMRLQRFSMAMPMTASQFDVIMRGGSSLSVGIYTMLHSTASLASSGTVVAADTGGNAYFWKTIPVAWSLSCGEYLVGIIASSGSAAIRLFGEVVGNVITNTILGIPGGGTYAPYFQEGYYSVGTGALPGSIHLTDINNSVGPEEFYFQMAGS